MFVKRHDKHSPPRRKYSSSSSIIIEKSSSRTKLIVFATVLCLTLMYLVFKLVADDTDDINMGNVQTLLNSDKGIDLEQDDPELVEFVKKHHIFQGRGVVEGESEIALSPLVQYLQEHNLIGRVTGDTDSKYFVEIGATDGFSSGLYLGDKLGWNGLLVEPVAEPLQELMQRSTTGTLLYSNATISMKQYPSKEKFHYNPSIPFWGGLSYRFYKGTTSFKTVVTIPLYTLLRAADSPSMIDLLIMDVEGAELDILKTVPFKRLEISVIVVETFNGKDGPSAVSNFLLGQGYKFIGKIKVPLDPELVAKISSIITQGDVHSEYQIFELK